MVLVSVKRGDITLEESDAIVNPANSYGYMGGGVAYAIKSAGGCEIEEEAISLGPTPVGEAVATKAGRLRARYVIHAPTMEEPAQRIGRENVEAATYAALVCASRLGVESVSFPGMGTGVGGVSKHEAADAMVKAINRFFSCNSSSIKKVVLVAFDESLHKEFEVCLKDAGF